MELGGMSDFATKDIYQQQWISMFIKWTILLMNEKWGPHGDEDGNSVFGLWRRVVL